MFLKSLPALDFRRPRGEFGAEERAIGIGIRSP
jgi:hypothetical protein